MISKRTLIEKLLVGSDWEIITKDKESTVLDKEDLEISVTDTIFSFGNGDFDVNASLENVEINDNGITLSFSASCVLYI